MASNINEVTDIAGRLGVASASFQDGNQMGSPPYIDTGSGPNSRSNPIVIPDDDNDDNGAFQIARYYEVVADRADDETLLHPPPAEPVLYDHERVRIVAKLGGRAWEAGDTIRLLSELAQIKTGFDIDPSLPLPPGPPKRLILHPQHQKIAAGVLLDDPGQGHSSLELTQHGWAYGSPIYISVFAEERQCQEGYFADAKGRKIEVSDDANVIWNRGFESYEMRVACARNLYSEVKSQMHTADKQFEEAAKVYRIGRRLWEIMVVKHEFFELEKKRLFHPASTVQLVKRVIKVGEKEIKAEDEGNAALQKRGWELVEGVDGQQIAQRRNR